VKLRQKIPMLNDRALLR